MDLNGVNLNANEIFAKLDSMDKGGSDGKIEASIWNQFADVAGGNHVNYAIEQENALKSISTYLARATNEVKTKIAEFVNAGASSTGNKVINAVIEQVVEAKEKEIRSGYEYAKEKFPELDEKVHRTASNGMSFYDAMKILSDLMFFLDANAFARKGLSDSEVVKIAKRFLSNPDDIYHSGISNEGLAKVKNALAAVEELSSKDPSLLEKDNICSSYNKCKRDLEKYEKIINNIDEWRVAERERLITKMKRLEKIVQSAKEKYIGY